MARNKSEEKPEISEGPALPPGWRVAKISQAEWGVSDAAGYSLDRAYLGSWLEAAKAAWAAFGIPRNEYWKMLDDDKRCGRLEREIVKWMKLALERDRKMSVLQRRLDRRL